MRQASGHASRSGQRDIPKEQYSLIPTNDPAMPGEPPSQPVRKKRKRKTLRQNVLQWLQALFCCHCCKEEEDEDEVDEVDEQQEEITRLKRILGDKEEEITRLQAEIKGKKEEITRQNERLQAEIKGKQTLEKRVKDLELRLSQMASERMRTANPLVEDMSDRDRPTALAEKWNGLFKSGSYWTAYAAIQTSGKTEAETTAVLYKVCQTVYKTCTDVLSQVFPIAGQKLREGKEGTALSLEKVISKVKSVLPDCQIQEDDLQAALKKVEQSLESDFKATQEKLREAVCKQLRQNDVPKSLQERVLQALRDDPAVHVDIDILRNFVLGLLELCYKMRLLDIPMAADFRFQPGSEFDPSLLEAEGGASQASCSPRIRCVLRPPLLRQEGGAVLSRGEVELEKEEKRGSATSLADKAGERPSSTRGSREGLEQEAGADQKSASPSSQSSVDFSLPNSCELVTTEDENGKKTTKL